MTKQSKRSIASPNKSKLTKKAQLQELISRRKGVGSAELEATLGWQAHTVRAAISGLRRDGMTITCTKGVAGSVYKLHSSPVGRV